MKLESENPIDIASFYFDILIEIREEAKRIGYTIAVRESSKYLDLIALPMTAIENNEDRLIRAIEIIACGFVNNSRANIEEKFCGRRTILIPINNKAALYLSITPNVEHYKDRINILSKELANFNIKCDNLIANCNKDRRLKAKMLEANNKELANSILLLLRKLANRLD